MVAAKASLEERVVARLVVECASCGRRAQISGTAKSGPRTQARFRCSVCGGEGRVVETPQKVACTQCGRTIPERRLEAVPTTRLCVVCADDDPIGQPNRRSAEPWGDREAWKRDRGSWRR
ncbi:hypothetical protein CKO28_24575 [Rhodovibrio sodomensis]|uniref:Zinc finger DksA/TraR C4-type domain-containing protein n=1 Tax=Rhodovibrio sodomensis TaxID=1088 RepID=A0ABS1DN87_9PROT|nr:hypothetical protein [Rhodovibrio sodomensis]